MKKFRAVTLLLALAMSVTVGLASCGGGETSTSVGGSSSSSDSPSGNSSSSASSAHQHVYTEEVVPPTCTEGGYTLHKCACGDSYRDNETPAAGHSWGELIVDTPATWDADGTGHRVCTVCETVGPGEVIPKDTSAWHEIFPEGNEDCFVYDDDGALTGMETAASQANMFLNMFAISDEVTSGAYSAEVTFDPTQSDKNEKGEERTYGIVPWYVDADNFLIYWLQQKAGSNWSGQFYGKVNGATRVFAANGAWSANEWDDMWWDGGTANPQIRNKEFAVINTVITLRVVSKPQVISIGEASTTVRAFELHQIVNGVDHIANTYYIKDVLEAETEGYVRTGVYSNKADVALSGFALTQNLWRVVSTEANEGLYTFDETTKDVAGIDCVDKTDLWLNMYAIYEVAPGKDYTVSATFDPTQSNKNAKGGERTYGLVAWYKDENNYLVYWLQQKAGGDWSGQFYGKVGGAFRSYLLSPSADGWSNGEWNDMWWDGGTANPQIKGIRHALLTTSVTLKIVSTVTEVTVGGEPVAARAFELHQVVNGEDHVASTYYVKDAVELTGVRTGVYANNYDIAIKDFRLA